ncbi:ABC transporter permease [Nitrosopumilus sp. S4]
MSNLLCEIWENRSLIILLATNDIKLRYRNSVLGFLWTFLEPLLILSILYLVFTNIIKSQVENYALFLLLSLILWYLFSRSTTMGLSSLIDKSNIIQKISIKHEFIVVSSAITAFLMMIFEFSVFGAFLILFQFFPSTTAFLLPLLVIDLFFLSLGFSLILAPLNVKFRDFRFIWGVVLQAGFFVTPIIYTLDILPSNIQRILEINPLVPIFTSAQNAVLYDILPSTFTLLQIFFTTITIFLIGYFVFKKLDKNLIEEL